MSRFVEATPTTDFCAVVKLTDSAARLIDLDPLSSGAIFADIRDRPELFDQVRLDPIPRTLAWPNGADLAPDVLLGSY